MRTRATPPFLLASDEAILAEPWTIEGQDLGETVEHWDPGMHLSLRRLVTVDVGRVVRECQLGRSTLALAATWIASTTRLSGAGVPVHLQPDADGNSSVVISLEVPSGHAGGDLTVRTHLLLFNGDPEASPLGATRPGSILWGQSIRTALEGGAARFPITPFAFSSSHRYPAEARWALEWEPADLHAPALGALRLMVNTDHPDICDAIVTGGTSPARTALVSFIRLDIARSLIHGALENTEFIENPGTWDEATLGRMLAELVTLVWPDVNLGTLRDRRAADPGLFDAQINARFPVGVS